MIEYYAIVKCPKCGIEIPIEHGYSCGFDATINMVVDTICRDKNCMNKFTVDFNINEYEIIDVDMEEFKPINNNLVGIDSYNEYCENLLTFIKKI